MEMRYILCYKQPWKCLSCCSICSICGNGSDDMNAVSRVGIKNRAAADTIDCDAVDQITARPLKMSANYAGKETDLMGLYRWIAEEANIASNRRRRPFWLQWYEDVGKRDMLSLK